MSVKLARRLSLALSALLVVLPTLASASPTNDIPGWSERFQQAALQADTATMVSLIEGAADPRFDIGPLKNTFADFLKAEKDQKPIFSEQMRKEEIGTIYIRLTIDVMYIDRPVFYTITFMRGISGWQIVYISMNTDINKVLHMDWPH